MYIVRNIIIIWRGTDRFIYLMNLIEHKSSSWCIQAQNISEKIYLLGVLELSNLLQLDQSNIYTNLNKNHLTFFLNDIINSINNILLFDVGDF